jgi:hypothetical protein
MFSSRLHAVILAAGLCVAVVSSGARADEVPLVTGEHWTKSSDPVKKAYLIGIANALQIEAAYQGANPPSDSQSLVPTAAKGLKGQTLDSVRQTVDAFYAAHPERLQTPVFEIVWQEVVVPGYSKAGMRNAQ